EPHLSFFDRRLDLGDRDGASGCASALVVHLLGIALPFGEQDPGVPVQEFKAGERVPVWAAASWPPLAEAFGELGETELAEEGRVPKLAVAVLLQRRDPHDLGGLLGELG